MGSPGCQKCPQQGYDHEADPFLSFRGLLIIGPLEAAVDSSPVLARRGDSLPEAGERLGHPVNGTDDIAAIC